MRRYRKRLAPITTQYIEDNVTILSESGCWIWNLAVTTKGYGYIKIAGRKAFAHRVSYSIFNGEIPIGMLVCHRCDTPLCVNPTHLWLGTISDNVVDMVSKGRHAKTKNAGTKNGMAKLDVETVRTIRMDGSKRIVLANQFGVSLTTIHNIKSGHSWVFSENGGK